MAIVDKKRYQKLSEYLDKSGRAMIAATMLYDHARAAEKMTNPNYVGNDNEAWKNGPYLSAPANKKQIDHSHPYCIRTSIESGVTAKKVMGENPAKAENGGVRIPLPPKSNEQSMVEPAVSKLAIIEQYELFKEFLITFNGPLSQKHSIVWKDKVSENILQRVQYIGNLRNDLTHEYNSKSYSMKEAVEIFYELQYLSTELAKVEFEYAPPKGKKIWIPEELVEKVNQLIQCH